MNYLWSIDDKKVSLQNDGLITSSCYYNDRIYAVENQKLVCFDCENGSKFPINIDANFIQVCSTFGKLFAISDSNYLFAFVDDSSEFIELNIISSGPKCQHGTQLQYRIKITSISSTELSSVITDDSFHLWSFSNNEISSEPIYATKIELNNSPYVIRQIVSGKKHCVVLVDFTNVVKNNLETSEYSYVCQKCNEDSTLRLSTLMKNADEELQETSSTETELADLVDIPSTSQCNKPEKSRMGFNQILSSIRHPFSKISTPISKTANKSEWYAIPAKQIKTSEEKPDNTDIELTSLSKLNFNTVSVGLSGSVNFSFVSLDNLISSSDNSSTHNDQMPLFEQSELHSFVSDQLANTFCEVWAFGANDLGQLGIGNSIPTRIPKRVKLPKCPVIKLSAGDNFTLALLASGEIFGWGANENNQLKLDSNYSAEPIQIKIGSKLCAIDIAAFSNTSYIAALSTDHHNVVICRFSRAHSKELADQGITRLDCLEKSCLAMNLYAYANGILLGNLLANDDNTAKMKTTLKIISQFILCTRKTLQLANLTQAIKEKNENQPLNSLSSCIWQWGSALSQLSENLRNNVFINGDFELKDGVSTKILTFDCLMQSFLKYYYSCLDCISESAFNELKLSSEMQKTVEQLSFQHGTESSKEFKRIRALLCEVPKQEFMQLVPAIGRVLTVDQSSKFWRQLENDLNTAEKWAKLTARNADLRTSQVPTGVLLAGFFEEPNFHIQNRSTYGPTLIRHFLTKQKNIILIWTDALVVIQKDSVINLEYPLLRLQKDADNPLLYCASDPEAKIDIEFIDMENATQFIELIHQAWEFSKRRHLFSRGILNYAQPNPSFFETRHRFGKYTFSVFHKFANAVYEGAWFDNQPHGKGKLTYSDGRQYTGRFVNGLFHGFGELLTGSISTNSSLMGNIFYSQQKNLIDICYSLKGCFKKGELNGLGTATFLNGDEYQGYFENNKLNGHGVYRTAKSVYVGGFSNNEKHGYGVLSTNKDRYLGEWFESKRHGLGTIITIDGVFHEGLFDNDKFVNGRVFYETPSLLNPASIVEFDGNFSGLGMASGKGTLFLNKHDKIVGTFNGSIFDLSITNAIYTHSSESSSVESEFVVTSDPVHSKWTVHSDKKWRELFTHYNHDVFNITDAEFQRIFDSDEEIPVEISNRAWENLTYQMNKIKQQKGITFDDRLERIPNGEVQALSPSYYAFVSEYWSLASDNEYHPLCRLLQGLGEVFRLSYASVGTSHVKYDDSAVLEFRSLLARCYTVARILFINLPPTNSMYSLIPSNADFYHDTDSSASSSTAETMSIGSLEESMLKSSPSTDNPSRVIRVFQPSETQKSNLLAPPCCDFLIEYFFNECYADLFTLYSERCQAANNRYWSKIMYLSSFTDVNLLRFLDLKDELWPINLDNTRDLDTFSVRVNAKSKFYGSAIQKLQELSATINPSKKLAILAETFYEITMCTAKFSSVGSSHTWSIDELLPAFIYVVIRAQVQHLGAEIRLLHDFSPHVGIESSSEIAMMFTVLQSAFLSICLERGSP